MARFLNALEQAKWHIISLYSVMALLFMLSIGLMIGWHSSQTRLLINIPPQIPASGIAIRANEVPPATVYAFCFYIWQSINHWSSNGADDYKKNIVDFQPYLTPKFQFFLKEDYNTRLSGGELQERLRTMMGVNGSAFDSGDVTYLGHDTWIVNLKMRLTERMDNTGNPIKDVEIDYALRVVRYDIDASKNKWGLALDGFETDPSREKTFA